MSTSVVLDRLPKLFWAVTLLLLLPACVDDLLGIEEPVSPNAHAQESATALPTSGQVTLYSTDILQDSYCFGTASYGAILQDGQVRNASAQLEFGRTGRDQLSVVGSGGEEGIILILSSHDENSRSLFYGITRSGNSVTVSPPGSAGVEDRTVELPEFNRVRRVTEVHARAICVLRIENLAKPIGIIARKGTAYIKLLVLEYVPGQSVTLKWEVL